MKIIIAPSKTMKYKDSGFELTEHPYIKELFLNN